MADGAKRLPAKKATQPLVIPRSAAEEQRLKLERLMRNPEKQVLILEKPKDWAPRPPPEFVRDVMGSSAGAGSGEFHVYRHLRRREYMREEFMEKQAGQQRLEDEFQTKLDSNRKVAEEKTEKRRKKRAGFFCPARRKNATGEAPTMEKPIDLGWDFPVTGWRNPPIDLMSFYL
ncbi:PRKR-interacting protein 1 homolog isoform X2 [Scyliorhinus canicula]|uniref:PRKR-interacting protein 1 homolog isoform X2 n=1 Tax=Scyliorhinus canicula TaxID=7830 RepID=UPI0018F51209|nr:PRKR-interacting protein 1 homolog isoform X2 [Scyliorhinus canicula]